MKRLALEPSNDAATGSSHRGWRQARWLKKSWKASAGKIQSLQERSSAAELGQNGTMPHRPLLIGLGGLVGALVRWAVLETVGSRPSLVTLALNLFGSLLIGWLVGRGLTSPSVWALVALGFCGGLTTFSSFAVDVADRLDQGHLASSSGLLLVTVGLSVLAAATGYRVGRWEYPPTAERI